MIFAWMNARVDVDIERKRERREKGEEKKREWKGRQIAGYFFFYGIPNGRVVSLSVSRSLSLFSLFLSLGFSLSPSCSLIYPASPLLKRQKFLIELLFFAGDFLELQKEEKKRKVKQFFLRRHSTPSICIPILYREIFDYIRKMSQE